MEIHEQTYNRFINQHRLIKRYIDHLPPKAINNRVHTGKRSIHETIVYLCRYQYVFMDRLNRILKEVNPSFKKYEPHADNEFRFLAVKSTGALLHDIYRVRDEMKQILDKLNAEQCSRTGVHVKMGRMNISQWLEFFLLQEAKHLYQIFKTSSTFNIQAGSPTNEAESSFTAKQSL